MKKLALFVFALIGGIGAAQAAVTTLKWHGHAAFEIRTPKGKVLLIDPWLRNPLNPAAANGKDPVKALGKVDYILVTHGHFDHVGESVEIAKKTKARLVASFELGTNMARVLGYPKDQMGFDTLGNAGGELPLADGEITVIMVPAVHSSGLDSPANEKKNLPVAYGGNPLGFVIKIQGGPTVYHSGDTALFSDLALVGESNPPDVALINVGGHFAMTPEQGVKAAQAIKAKMVIPQHYKTFPILTQNVEPFITALGKAGIHGREMKPGEELHFEGTKLVELVR